VTEMQDPNLVNRPPEDRYTAPVDDRGPTVISQLISPQPSSKLPYWVHKSQDQSLLAHSSPSISLIRPHGWCQADIWTISAQPWDKHLTVSPWRCWWEKDPTRQFRTSGRLGSRAPVKAGKKTWRCSPNGSQVRLCYWGRFFRRKPGSKGVYEARCYTRKKLFRQKQKQNKSLQWRHNNNKYNNLRQQQHFIKKSITILFQHLEPYHD